jgi:hypothetical protein
MNGNGLRVYDVSFVKALSLTTCAIESQNTDCQAELIEVTFRQAQYDI